MPAEHAPHIDNEFDTTSVRYALLGMRLRYSKRDAGTEARAASTRHPHHELIYVEAGEGVMRIGAELIRARPGDAFLLPPGAFHRHSDPATWSTWALSFSADTIEPNARREMMRLLSNSQLQSISIPEHARARWQARFQYLSSELDSDRVGDVNLVRSVLRSILIDVQQQLSPDDAGGNLQNRKRLLDAVFAYIEAHYREPIRLQDVAAAVHYSPAYLTDLIRRETGKAVVQSIAERRMQAARILLAETDRSIAAIAEDVGFRDVTYFGRLFAKSNGVTPRAWRKDRDCGSEALHASAAWNMHGACRAFEDYSHLLGLGMRLSSARTRDEVECAVLDAAHASFDTSIAQVLRRDPARKISAVVLQSSARDSADFPSERDAEGALPVILERQTVVAQDLRHSPLDSHLRISRLGYRCFLVAPIFRESECVGAIRILERKPHAFSERERSVLAMFGVLAGLAMHGVR